MIERIRVTPSGPGLFEFTDSVEAAVGRAGLAEGLCTLFVQHTSASLVIQENADPSARRDLERWLARLVPEDSTSSASRHPARPCHAVGAGPGITNRS